MKEVLGLSDSELVDIAKELRAKEKKILYSLLLHLGEIDERKLYRDEGYSSFYAYLTEGLHYSNSGAYRRIEAARFLRKKPELYGELTSGRLTFSALVELSKCADKENLPELVKQSAEKSIVEVAALVERERAPVVSSKPKERVRRVKTEASVQREPLLASPEEKSTAAAEVEEKFELTFQADKEFMKLYQEAKALVGGRNMEEVFRKVLSDYTKRKSPKERMKRRKDRVKALKPKGRYVPAAVKDQVYVRDGARCTYEAPDGTRCNCTHNLELDHIQPYALGGESTPENLRLLCRAHNQLMAERVYGKTYVERKRLH